MNLARKQIYDTTLLDEAGKRVSAQAVHCDYCNRFDTISANAHGGLPPDVARKKFIQRGWIMGKKATCPRCVAKFKAASKAKSESRVIAMTSQARVAPLKTMADLTVVKQVAALPPREMTATDRRRVFRAVDDDWDDANGRYLGDATDQKIATALVVPRAWVEAIRVENFGEVATNDEIEKLRAELSAFTSLVDGHCNESLSLASRFDSILKALGELRARMERVDKAVGLRK